MATKRIPLPRATETIGDPGRFAFNGDGTCDWHSSAGLSLDRALAMVDMIYAYAEFNKDSFPELRSHTLDVLANAIQAKILDVEKLLSGWSTEQWEKERALKQRAEAAPEEAAP